MQKSSFLTSRLILCCHKGAGQHLFFAYAQYRFSHDVVHFMMTLLSAQVRTGQTLIYLCFLLWMKYQTGISKKSFLYQQKTVATCASAVIWAFFGQFLLVKFFKLSMPVIEMHVLLRMKCYTGIQKTVDTYTSAVIWACFGQFLLVKIFKLFISNVYALPFVDEISNWLPNTDRFILP